MSKKELRKLIDGNKPAYPAETKYVIKDPAHCLLIWNELVDRYNTLTRLGLKTKEEIRSNVPHIADLYEFISELREELGPGAELLSHVLQNCYFSICLTELNKFKGDPPGTFRLQILLEHINKNKLCSIYSDPLDHNDLKKHEVIRFLEHPVKTAFWHIYKTAYMDHMKEKSSMELK